MVYEYTGINESATISLKAGAALTSPKGIALALDGDGLKLPSAGADVVGIAILTNEDSVAAGDRVDVQIKDIGKIFAGGAITLGALVSVNAYGKAVAAQAGDTILGRALTAATAAGDLIDVQILHAGGASATPGSVKMADIADVDLSTPATNGQILKYNSTSQKWEPAADATE